MRAHKSWLYFRCAAHAVYKITVQQCGKDVYQGAEFMLVELFKNVTQSTLESKRKFELPFMWCSPTPWWYMCSNSLNVLDHSKKRWHDLLSKKWSLATFINCNTYIHMSEMYYTFICQFKPLLLVLVHSCSWGWLHIHFTTSAGFSGSRSWWTIA